MNFTSCPDCGSPAEITDQFVLGSTGGPVEHVRISCVRRHWFLLPIPQPSSPANDTASTSDETPANGASRAARVRGPGG